jgi:hypothetical protein
MAQPSEVGSDRAQPITSWLHDVTGDVNWTFMWIAIMSGLGFAPAIVVTFVLWRPATQRLTQPLLTRAANDH